MCHGVCASDVMASVRQMSCHVMLKLLLLICDTGCCVNELRAVGHCGGSELNYINTVQFLVQTDCFVS